LHIRSRGSPENERAVPPGVGVVRWWRGSLVVEPRPVLPAHARRQAHPAAVAAGLRARSADVHSAGSAPGAIPVRVEPVAPACWSRIFPGRQAACGGPPRETRRWARGWWPQGAEPDFPACQGPRKLAQGVEREAREADEYAASPTARLALWSSI